MRVKDYILQSLYSLGLNETEGRAYHALLNGPSKTAAEIMHVLGLSLAGTYKVIHALLDKNLIEVADGRRPFHFRAVSLHCITKNLEKKSRQWKRMSERLKELAKFKNLPEETNIISENEVPNFYLEILSKTPDFLSFMGSYDAILNLPGQETEFAFVRDRLRRGIPTDGILFDHTPLTDDLEKRNWREKREFRYFTIPNYPREFTYIFGDNVASFFQDPDGKVKAVHVESPIVARSRLLQLHALWNSTRG